MKINFKKISAIATSALMIGMSAGVAAAASYPAPFVSGGVADVAIVYGTGEGVSALDQTSATNIQTNLKAGVTSTGGTTTAPTGESVLLEKSSDHLNLGNTWGVFTGSIDHSNLPTLLAKGTYTAEDSDGFKYEQRITLGTPSLNHTRDSDYESMKGLDSNTPFVGFHIKSSTFILNYTLDFTTSAESDIVSGELEDFEGSTIPLFGKTYYVSDAKNGTSNTYLGTLTLLDTASTTTIQEGETKTVTAGGKDYTVSISTLTTTQVKFTVNGETTNELSEGGSYNLGGGVYLGVKDIFQRDVTGVVGSVEFSIGSGKLEIASGSEIELNDVSVDGVKGYVYRELASTAKIDKIVIEWIPDDEVFLTPNSELKMPGFGGIKFSMTDLVRPKEEKVIVSSDSENIKLTVPIKDGDASFDILYLSSGGRSTGNITGIGTDANNRLATSPTNQLTFYEKDSSDADQDEYFIASYNVSNQAESYLLRAKVYQADGSHSLNYTNIENVVTGESCTDKTTSSNTCTFGLVTLTIAGVNYTSAGIQSVSLTGGANVNFHTVYTKGGLKIFLPFEAANTTTASGGANFTNEVPTLIPGHGADSWYLVMDGEDKDDAIAGGTIFNMTINNAGTAGSYNLEVSQVNHGDTTGRQEIGSGTQDYERYVVDDVAPRVMHYTKSDSSDYAEVYYPTEDSETYAKVYITEESASTTETAITSGVVVVMDSEVGSVSSKNLIIVGGSCINSAAATVLGSAYCGAAFTQATGVGSGQFLIKGYSGAFTSGKIALIVAGYNTEDTVNAATYLTTKTVDTDKEYKGTSATEAVMSVA
jgi:hypothetical protein